MLKNDKGYFLRILIILVSSVNPLNHYWIRGRLSQQRPLKKLILAGLVFIALLYLPINIIRIRSRLARSKKELRQRNALFDNEKVLPRMIDDHDVISFDLFDTLVTRDVHKPTDLFFLMEKQAGIEGFAKIRMEAEIKANHSVKVEKGQANANLVEIYEFIPESMRFLFDTELQMEQDTCSPNPAMAKLFKYANSVGKKIVITSDTYFDRGQVFSILNKCGYDGFQTLYVSSSSNLSKENGKVFSTIIDECGSAACRILHIGDNRRLDIEMPKKYGLDAFYYAKGMERRPRLLTSESKVFEAINNGIVANALLEERTYFFEMGVSILGPLYLSVAYWIRQENQKDQNDAIYFLSRDGYLLEKIYNKLFDGNAKYAYVSRLVVRRAILTIKGIDPSLLFTDLEGKSFKNVIKTFIPNSNDEVLSNTPFEKSIIGEEFEWQYGGFIEFLQEKYGDYLMEQRNLLLQYLASLGMTDVQNTGIFDIGWNGTIQDGLQKLLRDNKIDTTLTGYYFGILDNPTNRKRAKNNKMKGYSFCLSEPSYSTEISERLFTAPHGTVIGYEKGREIGPLLDMNPNEESNHIAFTEIEKGVLWYIDHISKYLDQIDGVAIRNDCLAMLDKSVRNPDCDDLENISSLVHTDLFDQGTLSILSYWPSSILSRLIFRQTK